jgi:GT2 family glycosyltransferase
LIVICTKDRPEELRRALASIAHEPADVLLVDSSTTPHLPESDEALQALAPVRQHLHVRKTQPRLTAQRNIGIDVARSSGYDVVLFMDDDVVVEPGYVTAVLTAFEADPDVAGVGAVVTNEPPARLGSLKRLFGLWSGRPGAVLRSGRNVIGHYDVGPWPRPVDWLSGCCMSYRLDRIGAERFDERLVGPWGDDVDFGFRLSRRQRLVVDGRVRLAHHPSSVGRASARRLARSRVSVLHAWVREHADDGLRRSAFWWSVFGEVVISLLMAPLRPEKAAVAAGLLQGTADVVRHGSDRSRWVR